MTQIIPGGTSDPQDFQLVENGQPLVGTGYDVALVITFDNGVLVGSPAPTAAWLNQALGTVRVTGVDLLPIGQYRVRYQLMDGIGNVGYAPNGDVADEWDVVAVVP